MGCGYFVGDIVEVLDLIDPLNEPSVIATVKLIEPDNEIPGLYWLYLVSNEEVLNTNYHNTIGPYWEIREDTNPRVQLLSRAVI